MKEAGPVELDSGNVMLSERGCISMQNTGRLWTHYIPEIQETQGFSFPDQDLRVERFMC